jgi:protein-S-isoprenylcysteine O-methyltransferase Ste14
MRRAFPKRSLIVGLIAVPFWYFVFVSVGYAPRIAASAVAVTFVLLMIILLVVWRRANRANRDASNRSRGGRNGEFGADR